MGVAVVALEHAAASKRANRRPKNASEPIRTPNELRDKPMEAKIPKQGGSQRTKPFRSLEKQQLTRLSAMAGTAAEVNGKGVGS